MSKQQLEAIGIKAIKQLRKLRLKQGLPFMINDDKLPTDQCYLEYPDGSIKLVRVNHMRDGFKIISELGPAEECLLRQKYGLKT